MKEFHPTTVWIAEGTWVTIWYAIVIVSHRDIVMSDSHPVEPSSIVGIKCAILHVHKSRIHWNLYVSYVAYRINISTIGAKSRSYYMYMSWFWPNPNTPLYPTTLFSMLTHQGVGCPSCLDRGVRWSVRATWPPNRELFKPRSVRISLLFQCVLVLFFITSMKQLQPVCWCLCSKLDSLLVLHCHRWFVHDSPTFWHILMLHPPFDDIWSSEFNNSPAAKLPHLVLLL